MTPGGNCEAASQDNISNLKLMMRGCGLIGGSGAAEVPVRISKRQAAHLGRHFGDGVVDRIIVLLSPLEKLF